jgi:hypothetical protein
VLALTIDRVDAPVHERAKADPRAEVLTGLPRVGEFSALVILAQIGTFPDVPPLASWPPGPG